MADIVEQPHGPGPANRTTARYILAGLGLLALIILPNVLAVTMGRPANSTISLLVFMFIAVGVGSAWNVLGGYAGQLSLGHAAFYGLGAYTAGVLSVRLNLPGWWGLLIGPLVVIPVAAVIGWITFRLRGPYFTLATIAIGEIVFLFAKTFEFTGGSVGLSLQQTAFWPGEPTWLFGPPPGRVPFYWIALCLTGLAIAVSWSISRSRMGYYLRAIREDEDTAATIGIDTTRYKILALVVSAALVAMFGAFRANFSKNVDPETVLRLNYSIEIVLYAIIGGLGTVWGPVIGGVLLTLAGDWFLREFGDANQLIYGIMLVVVIFFLPSGLLGGARQLWARYRAGRLPRPDRSTPLAGGDHASA